MTEPQPSAAWANGLSEFIYHQLRQEYGLGVDEFIAVQTLLLELAKRDAIPSGHEELSAVLSPVLCTTSLEQKALPGKLKAWLDAETPRVSPRGLERTKSSPSRADFRKVVRLYRLFTMGAVLIVLCAAGWVYREVVADALRLASDKDTQKPSESEVEWEVDPALSEDLSSSNDAPLEVSLNELELSKESEPEGMTHVWGSFFLLLVVLGAGRWLFLWWQGRTFLNRALSQGELEARSLELDGAQLSDGPDHGTVARYLRARQPSLKLSLDVDKSVRESARAGGIPKQVFRRGTEVPEYLCLIDCRDRDDHSAYQIKRHLDAIASRAVFLNRFQFVEDPRICRDEENFEQVRTLSELESLYAGHHLVLFSDGRGLIDRIHGRPAHYLERFKTFRSATLVTPEPVASWGYHEYSLEQAGLKILPLSENGLAGVRDGKKSEQARARKSWEPLLPATFELDERTWLRHDEPAEKFIEDGMVGLRRYLGEDGFLWLCACAIYPEVKPVLTRRIGEMLTRQRLGDDFQGEVELRLARLPWMRAAYIPDWLRRRLLRAIPEEKEEQIRAGIQQTMLAVVDREFASGSHLEIAIEERRLLSSIWRRVTRRWGKEPRGPWSDRVFLDWTNGRLSFRLPKILTLSNRTQAISSRGYSDTLPYRTLASAAILTFLGAYSLVFLKAFEGFGIEDLEIWVGFGLGVSVFVASYVRHYMNVDEESPHLRSVSERVLALSIAFYLFQLADGEFDQASLAFWSGCVLLLSLPDFFDHCLQRVLRDTKVTHRVAFSLVLLIFVGAPIALSFIADSTAGWVMTGVLLGPLVAIFLFLRLPARTFLGQFTLKLLDLTSPGRWLLGSERYGAPERGRWVRSVDLFLSTVGTCGLSLPVFIFHLVREGEDAVSARGKRAAQGLAIGFFACFLTGAVLTSGLGVHRNVGVVLSILAAFSVFVALYATVRRSVWPNGKEAGKPGEVLDKLGPVRLWQRGPRRMIPLLFLIFVFPAYENFAPVVFGQIRLVIDDLTRNVDQKLPPVVEISPKGRDPSVNPFEGPRDDPPVTVGTFQSLPEVAQTIQLVSVESEGALCLEGDPSQRTTETRLGGVYIAPCHAGELQIWIRSGEAEARVLARRGKQELCLGSDGSRADVNVPGSLISLQSCKASGAQHWRLVPGEQWLEVRNDRDECLTISTDTFGSDAYAVGCDGRDGQRWAWRKISVKLREPLEPPPEGPSLSEPQEMLAQFTGQGDAKEQKSAARSKTSMASVVAAGRASLQNCWSDHLAASAHVQKSAPNVHMDLSLSVSPEGNVSSATVSGSSDQALSSCVSATARSWKFPEGEATTTLNVPLSFNASGDSAAE